jgi:HKD family nuclease
MRPIAQRALRRLRVAATIAGLLCVPTLGAAAERHCDPSFENCRTQLLGLIDNEPVGIDVAFWFMEDLRYVSRIIDRWKAGVPVRLIVDPRANSTYPMNAISLDKLRSAGIPMVKKRSGGILHWKAMIFAGQHMIQFGSANYSDNAFVPLSDYTNYVSETVYYTDDPSLVDSFKRKFDDLWVNTTSYTDEANVGTRSRNYPLYSIDPDLNFPPAQDFATRSVSLYNAEAQRIDVTMYRITDRRHSDAMLAAVARGVPVRLITETKEYRDVAKRWHSWNVDRMWHGGVQVRVRAHEGLEHQKSVQLHGQDVAIFGSSNWTSSSATSQEEHNYFTTKGWIFQWLDDQFERKWHNANPIGAAETKPFVPLPPDKPSHRSPADGAAGLASTGLTLTWYGGPWAHLYDIYFGESPDPPLFAADQPLGPSLTSSQTQSFTLPALTPGTTHYWRIVSKTAAYVTAEGPVWSFTTSGTTLSGPGATTVVVWPSASAAGLNGNWTHVNDSTAAGGSALWNANHGDSKISPAHATPASYFDLTFDAQSGTAYHLWVRLRAENNSRSNDSVHVQFSDAVTSTGAATMRIGSSSSAEVILQDGSGDGSIHEWGWADNGWGTLGPHLYFATSGTHTMRIQQREDGAIVDQIVLSPDLYLSTPPGAGNDDATILTPGGDGGPQPSSTLGPGDILLHSADAPVVVGDWTRNIDPAAATGASLLNVNRNAAKIVTAAASPADYFEMTFTAEANTGYRLWMRGRATGNYWGNDSVHVQFTGSVASDGSTPTYRVGTTESADVNLEDCYGCGLAEWGWQDNGWGGGVLGPLIYFSTSGTQTMRLQPREDGLAIDQILLSPERYLTQSPGAQKNDTTILQ